MKNLNLATAEILEKLALKFAIPGVWIQGWNAQNSYNEPISATDPEACKFCLGGGLYNLLCKTNLPFDARNQIIDLVFISLNSIIPTNYVAWNDTPGRTKEEIVALCNQAAAKLRQNA